MRRSTDRLYPNSAGPREREAERLIREQPGITVGELRDALGVGRARIWQLVARLERPRIRRAGEQPKHHGPRTRP